MNDSDKQLMQLVEASSSGDRKAWSELYSLYYEDLYTAAITITHSIDATEKAVQRAFHYAFDHFEELNNLHNFENWMKRLVVKEAEKQGTYTEEYNVPDTEYRPEEEKAEEMPAIDLDAEGRQNIVTEALDCLNDMEQTVMLMYGYDHKTTDEISMQLNLKKEDTEKILASGEKKVSAYIDKNGENKKYEAAALPFFLTLLTNLHPEKAVQPVIQAVHTSSVVDDGFQKSVVDHEPEVGMQAKEGDKTSQANRSISDFKTTAPDKAKTALKDAARGWRSLSRPTKAVIICLIAVLVMVPVIMNAHDSNESGKNEESSEAVDQNSAADLKHDSGKAVETVQVDVKPAPSKVDDSHADPENVDENITIPETILVDDQYVKVVATEIVYSSDEELDPLNIHTGEVNYPFLHITITNKTKYVVYVTPYIRINDFVGENRFSSNETVTLSCYAGTESQQGYVSLFNKEDKGTYYHFYDSIADFRTIGKLNIILNIAAADEDCPAMEETSARQGGFSAANMNAKIKVPVNFSEGSCTYEINDIYYDTDEVEIRTSAYESMDNTAPEYTSELFDENGIKISYVKCFTVNPLADLDRNVIGYLFFIENDTEQGESVSILNFNKEDSSFDFYGNITYDPEYVFASVFYPAHSKGYLVVTVNDTDNGLLSLPESYEGIIRMNFLMRKYDINRNPSVPDMLLYEMNDNLKERLETEPASKAEGAAAVETGSLVENETRYTANEFPGKDTAVNYEDKITGNYNDDHFAKDALLEVFGIDLNGLKNTEEIGVYKYYTENISGTVDSWNIALYSKASVFSFEFNDEIKEFLSRQLNTDTDESQIKYVYQGVSVTLEIYGDEIMVRGEK